MGAEFCIVDPPNIYLPQSCISCNQLNIHVTIFFIHYHIVWDEGCDCPDACVTKTYDTTLSYGDIDVRNVSKVIPSSDIAKNISENSRFALDIQRRLNREEVSETINFLEDLKNLESKAYLYITEIVASLLEQRQKYTESLLLFEAVTDMDTLRQSPLQNVTKYLLAHDKYMNVVIQDIYTKMDNLRLTVLHSIAGDNSSVQSQMVIGDLALGIQQDYTTLQTLLRRHEIKDLPSETFFGMQGQCEEWLSDIVSMSFNISKSSPQPSIQMDIIDLIHQFRIEDCFLTYGMLLGSIYEFHSLLKSTEPRLSDIQSDMEQWLTTSKQNMDDLMELYDLYLSGDTYSSDFLKRLNQLFHAISTRGNPGDALFSQLTSDINDVHTSSSQFKDYTMSKYESLIDFTLRLIKYFPNNSMAQIVEHMAIWRIPSVTDANGLVIIYFFNSYVLF